MKKTIFSILSFCLAFSINAQYSVKGGQGEPWMLDKEIQVCLLNGLSDAEISFTSASTNHQWYRYDTKAAEAVQIPCTQNGATSTITDVRDGYGYFVDLNPPVWIIDYSRYLPTLHSLNIEEGNDACEYLRLTADVESASALEYTLHNGQKKLLPRTFHLLYKQLVWNEVNFSFSVEDKDEPLSAIANITLDAPLVNTVFTLKGDDYAEHFGLSASVSTPEYEAVALEVHGKATSLKESGETEQEITVAGDRLGGSAPLEIVFDACANEPVAGMYQWTIKKINRERNDSTLILQYKGKSVNYTFRESGTYVAQLEVIGANLVCSDDSYSQEIEIGDSDLRLPNAFSPGSSIGSNDVYRVSYKSLVKFKASIYNRWGNLLFHWEDPAQGWDGRVNDKYVPTGVYYIVVEAQGADGKKYNKTSDINILRSKNH
jgi:gliding motility-associated-like protein